MFSNGPEYEARYADRIHLLLVFLTLSFWKTEEAILASNYSPQENSRCSPEASVERFVIIVPLYCSKFTSTTANTTVGALYLSRDIVFALLLFKFAASIQPWAELDFGGFITAEWAKSLVKAALWHSYWCVQGLVWTGIFCLGTALSHSRLHVSDPCCRTRCRPWQSIRIYNNE